jgi:hypothetical protein
MLGVGMVQNNESEAEKVASIESINTYSDLEACKLINTALRVWKNYLIPQVCSGTYVPGDQFQGSFAIRSVTPDIIVACGIDSWYQGQSYFRTHSRGYTIIPTSSAFQCNLFFDFEYLFNLGCFAMTFELIMQATVFNRNMQDQYGGKISLSVEY